MSSKTLDLKQRIVDRALELFNEHGLERVGMRELARDLALAPGNLTYHFARKEDLIVAIATRFTADNSALLVPSAPVPSFTQFLELVGRILHNQYRYRCLPLNIVYLLDDYPSLAARYHASQALRRTQFEQWLHQLHVAGYLRPDLTLRERDWLVEYCQLFGRAWVLEYWVFHRDQPIEPMIAHALSMLATAFMPYASRTGCQELAPFLEPLERGGGEEATR